MTTILPLNLDARSICSPVTASVNLSSKGLPMPCTILAMGRACSAAWSRGNPSAGGRGGWALGAGGPSSGSRGYGSTPAARLSCGQRRKPPDGGHRLVRVELALATDRDGVPVHRRRPDRGSDSRDDRLRVGARSPCRGDAARGPSCSRRKEFACGGIGAYSCMPRRCGRRSRPSPGGS